MVYTTQQAAVTTVLQKIGPQERWSMCVSVPATVDLAAVAAQLGGGEQESRTSDSTSGVVAYRMVTPVSLHV